MRRLLPVLSILLVALVPGARAERLSLSPAVIQLRGTYAQSTSQTLTLTNETRQPLDFELAAQDVVVREGRRVMLPAGQLPDSIATTAVFAPARVHVEPGGSASARVTLTVPPAVQHRAVVVLFRGTTRIGGGPGASFASLGTLMTFTLSDDLAVVTEPLEIIPQTATRNVRIAAPFRNAGREPVAPRGVAVVLDGGGALVGRSAFEARRVLPGERVVFSSEQPAELRPGRYRLVTTFDVEGQERTQSADLVVP